MIVQYRRSVFLKKGQEILVAAVANQNSIGGGYFNENG